MKKAAAGKAAFMEDNAMKIETVHLREHYPLLSADGKDPILTCYMPDNLSEMNWEKRRHRSMVVCPGGGYSMVSSREAEPVALKLLAMDFYVFVLTYSVAPHRYPAQILEVAAAFDYIRSRAEEWNVDTQRIGIMGFSAGAHLAAHYSTAFDCAPVAEHFPNARAPFATVLSYPVISPETAHTGSFINLIGPEKELSEASAMDAAKLVNDRTPRAFIWHTAADPVVPVVNSLMYAKALAEHGVPFEMHIYPDGYHGLSTSDGMSCDRDPVQETYDSQWLLAFKKWSDVNFAPDKAE